MTDNGTKLYNKSATSPQRSPRQVHNIQQVVQQIRNKSNKWSLRFNTRGTYTPPLLACFETSRRIVGY